MEYFTHAHAHNSHLVPCHVTEMAEADGREAEEETDETGDCPSTSEISSSEIESCRGSELDSGNSRVATLLSQLKRPTASDLARKRKLQTNCPPVGRKTSKGSAVNDPKSVSGAERVKAFPSEPFSVSSNKLFCTACREQLSLKKSTIALHIKSVKHTQGKE